jgi:GNAT superfamily N-acetyltransferase
MHRIRLAVRENALSDSTRIDESSYTPFVNDDAAWVAESGSDIIGFAALDMRNGSVWALFVDPLAEGLGAAKALHDRMLEFARQGGLQSLFLTTTSGTRAERFYRQKGWQEAGCTEAGELRFERLL